MAKIFKKIAAVFTVFILCMVGVVSLAAYPIADTDIVTVEDSDGNIIKFAYGDLWRTEERNFDILDFVLLVKYLSGQREIWIDGSPVPIFDNVQILAMDCYYDGIIDCRDAVAWIKRMTQQIDSLPVYPELANPADYRDYERENPFL